MRYQNSFHTIAELRAPIEAAVQNIMQQQLHAVFENMKKRVDACLDNSGAHFQQLKRASFSQSIHKFKKKNRFNFCINWLFV